MVRDVASRSSAKKSRRCRSCGRATSRPMDRIRFARLEPLSSGAAAAGPKAEAAPSSRGGAGGQPVSPASCRRDWIDTAWPLSNLPRAAGSGHPLRPQRLLRQSDGATRRRCCVACGLARRRAARPPSRWRRLQSSRRASLKAFTSAWMFATRSRTGRTDSRTRSAAQLCRVARSRRGPGRFHPERLAPRCADTRDSLVFGGTSSPRLSTPLRACARRRWPRLGKLDAAPHAMPCLFFRARGLRWRVLKTTAAAALAQMRPPSSPCSRTPPILCVIKMWACQAGRRGDARKARAREHRGLADSLIEACGDSWAADRRRATTESDRSRACCRSGRMHQHDGTRGSST